MPREYFCAFHSYSKSIEPLNDAERGRLFTALLEYSETGIAPELRGNERFIFPMMRAQIDRDNNKYREVVSARAEAGKKGASSRWQKDSKNSKCHLPHGKNGQGEDKGEDKEEPPVAPHGGDAFDITDSERRLHKKSLDDIADAWKAITGMYTGHDESKVQRLLMDVSPVWLLEAIHIAGDGKERTWRYVEGILRRFLAQGGPDSTAGGASTKKVSAPDEPSQPRLRRVN